MISPLWAVLLFTFLNSIGSAVVSSGIYFLAESRYGFGKGERFGLGVVWGIAYIPAAMFIGRLLTHLKDRGHRIGARGLLALTMLGMAAVCVMPSILATFEDPATPPTARAAWPVWFLMIVYAALSGAMWPMVEAFLAGGRGGENLRLAAGKFNVAWSSALVVTLLAIAQAIHDQPLTVLVVLAGVHIASIAVLKAFSPSPAEHVHEEHTHPPEYTPLLALMRVLLPTAFIVLASLAPYLPTARAQLGLSENWGTPLAAVWMSSRVCTFFLMERWHGWHGRWSTPLAGAILLLSAFTLMILAPITLSGVPARIMFFGGLVVFGMGIGVIYTAALYYAMEVGASEVDAGGTHEMLIGIGYTVGPLCGLLACGLASGGVIGPDRVEGAMLGLVGGICLLGMTLAVAVARRVRPQS